MTMKLETFDFNESPVRVMIRDNAPWFIATDVCRVRQLIKVLRVPQCSDVVTRVTPNVLGGCALKGLPVLCIDDLLSSLSDISSVALEQFTVARVWSYRPLRMPSVFTSRVDTIVIATALPGWQRRCRGLARRARVFNLGKGVGA